MPLFGLLLVLKTATFWDVKQCTLQCKDRHEGGQQLSAVNRKYSCVVGTAQMGRIFS